MSKYREKRKAKTKFDRYLMLYGKAAVKGEEILARAAAKNHELARARRWLTKDHRILTKKITHQGRFAQAM